MSRVEQAIDSAHAAGRSAFVGYLPVGFPDLETSIRAAVALAENGVDIIELGSTGRLVGLQGVFPALLDDRTAGADLLGPLLPARSCVAPLVLRVEETLSAHVPAGGFHLPLPGFSNWLGQAVDRGHR